MKSRNGYRQLAADVPFQAFLWTQFLAAFNDNVYKIIVSLMAVRIAASGQLSSRYLALAGVVFVLPFLLFAGYAGQLADRFSKTRVLQITKAFEIGVMLTGIVALISGRIELLLLVLFLLATQANFFSPAKYGILPEMMGENRLSRANGLLELSTFVAIVAGSAVGTWLYQHWRQTPLSLGLMLLAIAVAGSLTSLGIRPVPAAGSTAPFQWNPFSEILAGARSLIARRALLWSVLGISWFWLVGALFQMALLLAGKEVMHLSEAQSGLLVAALAVGIGMGSIAAGALSGDRIELGLVPLGSLLMGIFSIGFGLTRSFSSAGLWLVGVGFAGGLFVVPLNAFLQENSASTEKGRILATNNFANMLGVILSSGLVWMLHDYCHWTATAILIATGALMIAGTAAVIALIPAACIRFVLWVFGTAMFRIHVENPDRLPRTGGALLVANHVSFADALLLGFATPRVVRFLMWRPYYEAPVLHMLFRTLRAIPVSPRSPKENAESIAIARETLMSGEMVAIFPEGRITRSGEIDQFQRGFERIAAGTGAPIIPIHIDGLFGHPLSYKGGGLFRSWERILRPKVLVRIGEPICESISPTELRSVVVRLAARKAA